MRPLRFLVASTFVAVLLLAACKKAPSPPALATDEAAIRARYTQMMTSLCQDSFTNAVAVVDPETQANEGKMKLIYGGGRLLIGIGQHKPEDFRVDRVLIDAHGTNAQVFTSVQRAGKWEPDAKPENWLRLTNVWYVKM